MRLRKSCTVIMLGSARVVLRPTLGVAYALESRFGFPALLRGVAEENISMIGEILREGSNNAIGVSEFHHFLDSRPLRDAMDDVAIPLYDFVLELAGADQEPIDKASGDPISHGEFHTRLFRIATGWLGWSPSETWNATAAEIIEAHKGRIELLQAIFGKADKTKDMSHLSLDDKIKLTMLGRTTRVEQYA